MEAYHHPAPRATGLGAAAATRMSPPIARRRSGQHLRHCLVEDLLLDEVAMFLGVLTLVLAALGLYGVTAYSTSRRMIDFGLRSCLAPESIQQPSQLLLEARDQHEHIVSHPKWRDMCAGALDCSRGGGGAARSSHRSKS
jgi:hypothetical protein